MATTTIYTYTGDGIINLWTVAFSYLKKSHVKLYIDDVEDTTFTWVTDSSIAATSTPGDGAEVKVQRVTPRSALDTVLPNSGTFRGSDINNQSLQALYVAEEGYDALVNVLQLDPAVNEWDFQSYQSKNIPTPTTDDSAANKAYVDAVAGSATAAAASAAAAASSASAASTSATNASNSATSASTSASTATTQAAAASASATAAAASETAAAASETAAAASASAASSSASAASTSASNASTSASAAATSASNASTSETNAAASASAASTSASTASTAATNASNSASAASTSASNASTSATNASNSAAAASTSETNAAASASTASTAATTATTQAGIATTQAGNAATSATNASNAQTAAEAAQTAAELALDTFDDIFLGSKAVEPTLDNDGNALQQGALYWNSASSNMWIYNSGAWEVIAVPSSSSVTKTGTPADNQVAVWTADGIVEGTAGLTYDGTTFGVTGNLTISGTVDGRDVGADGASLDTVVGWGNHALAGYLTSETSHADVLVDGDFVSDGLMKRSGAGSYTIVADNSNNWNTAFGWGNHASAGYAASSHTHTISNITDLSSAVEVATLTFIIDGGGSAITTGQKGHLEVPFACTINQVTMMADQSGSIVVDIWKDTYANYPPTDADSITASAVPTISAALKSQDATLTGWTTSVAAGDILAFNVDSASTVTRVTISLKVTKT